MISKGVLDLLSENILDLILDRNFISFLQWAWDNSRILFKDFRRFTSGFASSLQLFRKKEFQ